MLCLTLVAFATAAVQPQQQLPVLTEPLRQAYASTAPSDIGAPNIATAPQPAKPKRVAEVCRELVEHFDWHGPIGVTFPAVIKRGIVRTAANVDPSWIGTNADTLITEVTSCEVAVLNDADAAGIAEMRFGAGAGRAGTTIMVTLGTGIGTALFVGSVLVPNTELGHIEIRGPDLNASVASEDAYKSIDLLVDKLDGLLRKRSNHRKDKIHHPHGVELTGEIPKV